MREATLSDFMAAQKQAYLRDCSKRREIGSLEGFGKWMETLFESDPVKYVRMVLHDAFAQMEAEAAIKKAGWPST